MSDLVRQVIIGNKYVTVTYPDNGDGTYGLPRLPDGSLFTLNAGGSTIPVKTTSSGGSSDQVGAIVRTAAGKTIASSVQVIIDFELEDFSTTGVHSTSVNNSRLTVPTGKGGIYEIHGAINWNYTNSGIRIIQLFVNGLQAASKVTSGPINGSVPAGDIFARLSLSAGDYVELVGYANTSGSTSLSTDGSSNYFSMFRI